MLYCQLSATIGDVVSALQTLELNDNILSEYVIFCRKFDIGLFMGLHLMLETKDSVFALN